MGYKLCSGHNRSVTDLSYSADNHGGSLLLTTSMDGSCILRDGQYGDWIRTFASSEQTSAVTGCSLTPSIAATASRCNANVWDVETGRLLHMIKSRQAVHTCAFSMSGKKLLTGGRGSTIRIFDLDHPGQNPEILSESNKCQHGLLLTAAWLQDDQLILATCSHEGGARIWDRRSGKICTTLEIEPAVSSSEVNQGYITIAAGSMVTFWDTTNFRCLFRYTMPCNVESASLHESKFIAGGEDGIVYMFDLYTRREIDRSYITDLGAVSCARFSPDGKSYASGFSNGSVIIKEF
ncbi:hypothetical protein ACHQM5_004855 [Ranunculus cassubicifolius]